ncbi:MAG: ferric reductase-like transmembrane domain-containing protein [Actinobacteria bacterium]|nr:ferric reductase-like transmembrane domain-containing protein [Actinomycetota bacterium]
MNVAPHLFWITSRAAGGAALLLASASVTVGLMISARRGTSSKRDLRSVHEALSLTTLAMVAVHGLSLLGDAYLDPGLAGIAIPFVSFYRPLWTALGIVAGYGLAALGLSYYLRDRIGASRWRRLHRLTAVFWVAAVVHTIGAGSDAAEPWFLAISAAFVVPAALLLALRWLGRGRNAEAAPIASVGALDTGPR